jgi:outer membrane beta-barrel protein
MKPHLGFALSILLVGFSNFSLAQGTNPVKPINLPAAKPVLIKELNPKEAFGDISSLFEDVVAVQRKALKKANSFLLSPYFSFDFSDSPYTMYGLNINAGYAPSEFWEIYINFVPAYLTQERNLSKKVRDLQLVNGMQAEIATEKAKMSYGAEILWSPAYGKDSWGLRGVVRSDTFFGLGLGMIKYESASGFKSKLVMGKTFFISDYFNFRVQAGVSFLESITNEKKEVQNLGLLEAGTVYYF